MGVDAKQTFTGMGQRMKVILVGPDCSGKTTLANMLAERYGLLSIKGLRIPDRQKLKANVHDTLDKWIADPTTGGVLMDRWQFPCDIIYEKVHGREESIFVPVLEELVNKCWDGDVLFLHVTAVPQTLVERITARGDAEINPEQTVQARMLYVELFSQIDFPVAHLDTSYVTLEQAYTRAVHLIEDFYLDVNRKNRRMKRP